MSRMNAPMGGTVVCRVQIPYDHCKTLTRTIPQGAAELEKL